MSNNDPGSQDEPEWKTATESKLKHLEMIQAVITRMANNSFLVKGWCLTLVSALLAFGGKEGKPELVFVAYLPVLMFWYLDGFFLQQERLFRSIYDYHRQLSDTDFTISPSDIPAEKKKLDGIIGVIFSKTLFIFYGSILFVLILATGILFRNWLKSYLC